LEAVSRLREYKKEAAKQDFVRLSGLLSEQEEEYRALCDSLKTTADSLAEKQEHGVALHQLDLYYGYFRKHCSEAAERKQAVLLLAETCEIQRSLLVEAVKEKKVVDTIDERRRGLYRKEVQKKEQQRLDEVAGRQSKGIMS
jgi:flagellar export protein FliJ